MSKESKLDDFFPYFWTVKILKLSSNNSGHDHLEQEDKATISSCLPIDFTYQRYVSGDSCKYLHEI